MTESHATRSIWLEPSAWPPEPTGVPGVAGPHLHGLEVDVVIVGAGITGLTAALELKRAGQRVAVLDAAGVGGGESLRTTAHLTEVLDIRFAELIRRFGVENARLVLEGQRLAIDYIETRVHNLSINCGFERLPGYLYAALDDETQRKTLEEEAAAATTLGFENVRAFGEPAPFPIGGALRFTRQAQMQPGPYLAAIVAQVAVGGGADNLVAGNVRVQSVEELDPNGAESPPTAASFSRGVSSWQLMSPATTASSFTPNSLPIARTWSPRRSKGHWARCTGIWRPRTTTFAQRKSAAASI